MRSMMLFGGGPVVVWLCLFQDYKLTLIKDKNNGDQYISNGCVVTNFNNQTLASKHAVEEWQLLPLHLTRRLPGGELRKLFVIAILDVNVSESGTTIIEGIFKFKPDFKKESCPVLGDPRHITQTVINELERYFIGKLTPDEVESIVTKLKRTHGLAPGAMENFM